MMTKYAYHGTHRTGSSRENRWVCFSLKVNPGGTVKCGGVRYDSVNQREFQSEALADRERDRRYGRKRAAV